MADSKPQADKVFFSREQYEYLNKMFPEVIPQPEDSINAVYTRAGNRRVVYFVKERMK